MVCLVSTVCIFSITVITYTHLSNMACPNRVVSWANTVCVHWTVWTGHDALVSTLINTSPHLPLWRHEYISSVWRFSFNHDHVISILNFPVNDLCHDSIGNKLFGFVFSRSDEPIVIGVCGMRSADQDHRIVSEPIASGSFLESGPGPNISRRRLNLNQSQMNCSKNLINSDGTIIREMGHWPECIFRSLLRFLVIHPIDSHVLACVLIREMSNPQIDSTT